VLLTWKPVAWDRRPIVEYSIYRRAPGDTGFNLVAGGPAASKATTCRYLDEGVSIGITYEYAVAAAFSGDDGLLRDGRMSEAVRGAPADFRIGYAGGNDQVASVTVEKLHGGALRRQNFLVREGKTIGEVKTIRVEPQLGRPYRALVDFSTGYRLVEIVTDGDGGPGRRKIVIENDAGMRREVPMRPVAGEP
jgi:hypothetical protein